ncbi:unnamed protein product [Caenorhabditis brenneri]
MTSLLDMTDVPMKNILENCGFKSVLTLRKVCHSLRNFIDDSCFKTDLDNIDITIGPTGFAVLCEKRNALRAVRTGYAKDWTSKDLKIFLKMAQNSKLSCFSVNTNSDNAEGLDDLEDILKKQTRPLQTEYFKIKGSGILKVLPYLDPKTLKGLFINPANYETYDQNLDDIEQFLELEQFKNAVKLEISFIFLVRADLRKFFHLQQLFVRLHETSMEEVVALKEAFVTSTHMESFDLNCRGLRENQLEQVFGTPFHDDRYPLDYWRWFFEIRNFKEYVLRIEWVLGNLLRFCKWKAKEVPQGAVVQH